MSKDLATRLRAHVIDRGGMSKDADGNIILPNGAWSMMLEAADEIDRLKEFEWMYKDLCA